jgi:diguanylate cyclase (GGDEF)-like protein
MDVKTRRRSLIRGSCWAVALSGLALAAFIGILVAKSYLAQSDLRESALKYFQQDLEKQASGLSYFFSERENDLKNLPTKREIDIFFENKAMGMSMEYGMKSRLSAIHDSFDLVLKGRMLGEDRIYTRFVLIDSSGECLVDGQGTPLPEAQSVNWQQFLTPGISKPVILVESQEGQGQLIVSTPYLFKGKYSGQILAWISNDTIQKHFIHDTGQLFKKTLCMFARQSKFYLFAEKDEPTISPILPALPNIRDREWRSFKATPQEGAPVEMVCTSVPIRSTPLFLLGAITGSELFGNMSPWYLPVTLGSLSILCLLGVGIIWRDNTRNLILHTRLEDAAIKEQEIREKNQQLKQEIAERKRADEALQKANEKLRVAVHESFQQNRHMVLFHEMSDLLQTCQTRDEAYTAIAQFAPKIFANESGALYMFHNAKNLLEAVAVWGNSPPQENVFEPAECWAMRRSSIYHFKDANSKLICKHVSGPLTSGYFCIPIIAHSEAMGLLHVQNASLQKPSLIGAPLKNPLDFKERLALNLAKHIGLSLSNLRLRESLHSQAVRDPLTGLYNRRYMEETMERELTRARRHGLCLGIIMLDIDYFKQFNDAFGHTMGDLLLSGLGHYINTQIRGEDIACRFGGEEFLVILPGASLEATLARAEQFRLGIKQLRVRNGDLVHEPISVSIGMAVFPQHGSSAEAVTMAADAALYQAKNSGRDRLIIAQETFELPNDIEERRALSSSG